MHTQSTNSVYQCPSGLGYLACCSTSDITSGWNTRCCQGHYHWLLLLPPVPKKSYLFLGYKEIHLTMCWNVSFYQWAPLRCLGKGSTILLHLERVKIQTPVISSHLLDFAVCQSEKSFNYTYIPYTTRWNHGRNWKWKVEIYCH